MIQKCTIGNYIVWWWFQTEQALLLHIKLNVFVQQNSDSMHCFTHTEHKIIACSYNMVISSNKNKVRLKRVYNLRNQFLCVWSLLNSKGVVGASQRQRFAPRMHQGHTSSTGHSPELGKGLAELQGAPVTAAVSWGADVPAWPFPVPIPREVPDGCAAPGPQLPSSWPCHPCHPHGTTAERTVLVYKMHNLKVFLLLQPQQGEQWYSTFTLRRTYRFKAKNNQALHERFLSGSYGAEFLWQSMPWEMNWTLTVYYSKSEILFSLRHLILAMTDVVVGDKCLSFHHSQWGSNQHSKGVKSCPDGRWDKSLPSVS